MKVSRAVVKYRIPILIVTVLLLIPATIGYLGTRVNYDMLDYLPTDMDTVVGQNVLMDEFGKGAFSGKGRCGAQVENRKYSSR